MRDLLKRLRMWPWLLLALCTAAVVGVVAPQQLGVLVWSLSKVCIGAYVAYWIHRSIERGPRPHELLAAERSAALLRRTILVAAVIIARGVGV